MTNLKSLELDGDPYRTYEDDKISTGLYPLHRFEFIKGLKKLKLTHSDVSRSIQACGNMMLDLLPKMPNLTMLEIEFSQSENKE